MTTPTDNYKRAYIWELPIRIFHWANAFSILGLIITGFLIAYPPGIISTNEATNQFWFGEIRKIHFMFAYIMVAVLIMRVYFAFMGNKYASWRVFFPFNKKGFSKMWHIIKYDIFLQREKEYDFKNISVGHNNIAAVSYLIMFIMAILMILTGFGMYAPTATWFFPKMFAWVPEFFGGDLIIRTIHHITMWGFILFSVIHVYLVFFHDWLESRGESSSMISGYKFVRSERLNSESTTEEETTKKNN
ncbi:MAG TPA: Ni/Fe-hydrogenase, b-type cytochrome subunit [Flavobacterium sp.]|uniref:Ni/Fe-hydrogenase, b-type cytochrome subunit n=1 Tax=Flavobacterium sp. TaxID=239 RepID=UPI002B4B73F6|nr:Ni/Fe-hydrogenase, b-type cytochrome subunit [Flavobacterium sp.]HLO74223.1 Ni/Fe-hydrogenase, b-type cytochrome subunit [Flavobacterium sp.]